MPRQAHLDAPGALQHIIVRGMERRKLFGDDAERKAFVERLGRLLTKQGFRTAVRNRGQGTELQGLGGNSHCGGVSFFLTGGEIGVILQLYERKSLGPREEGVYAGIEGAPEEGRPPGSEPSRDPSGVADGTVPDLWKAGVQMHPGRTARPGLVPERNVAGGQDCGNAGAEGEGRANPLPGGESPEGEGTFGGDFGDQLGVGATRAIGARAGAGARFFVLCVFHSYK